MTREEAIVVLKNEQPHCGEKALFSEEKKYEAYDVAIKALEQEHILDKIRAEIMQLDYDTDYVDYDCNDMAQTETIHTICREEVFHIIDKYKTTSTRQVRNSMTNKRYKVWLIKEYVVTADSKEEAIESAKFRYDYSNDSSYCAVWDKVQCREYKEESEDKE